MSTSSTIPEAIGGRRQRAQQLVERVTRSPQWAVLTVHRGHDGSLGTGLESEQFPEEAWGRFGAIVAMLPQLPPPTPSLPRRHQHLWGESQTLFHNAQNELARLVAPQAGGASSVHCHQRKDQMLWVVSGKISIVAPPNSLTIRQAGEACVIPAGNWHRLIFHGNVEAFELYVAVEGETLDLRDIVRQDDGWRPGERTPAEYYDELLLESEPASSEV